MISGSESIGLEALHFLIEGLGGLAMFLIGFLLKDLRDRIARLENFLMGPPTVGVQNTAAQFSRKVGAQ